MKNGFSFIETIVVVVVMGVMLAGGTIAYSNFSNRREVDEATSKIISQLEVARSKAKAGVLPPGVSQSQANIDVFRYVEVSLTSGMLRLASNHAGSNEYSQTDVGNINIEPNELSDCDVCFSFGDCKLVGSSGGPREHNYSVSLEVSSKKDNQVTRTIVIDSSGVIKRE